MKLLRFLAPGIMADLIGYNRLGNNVHIRNIRNPRRPNRPFLQVIGYGTTNGPAADNGPKRRNPPSPIVSNRQRLMSQLFSWP